MSPTMKVSLTSPVPAENKSVVHAIQSDAHPFEDSQEDKHADELWMLLAQARICCEEARQAAGRRHFRAACGLLATAIALYRLLLRAQHMEIEQSLRQKIEEQLRHTENEKAVHLKLCSPSPHFVRLPNKQD